MNVEKEFPKRKHPRLDKYDYSSPGAYFVTICTQNRKCVLSRIFCAEKQQEINDSVVVKGTNNVEYTPFGEIAKKQLLMLEKRYPHLHIDQYVIMPNHIHIIIVLDRNATEDGKRPTIMDIVCSYKSLTTRECKREGFEGKMFQVSFYEHIIRGRDDYEEIAKYIYENPLRWYYDELYSEE